MAIVRPFRAIRPGKEYAAAVAALPYDVMNSDEARELVEGNPNSFLHVDKAEIDLPAGTDIHSAQVYAKAAENLNAMIRGGILIQDDKPMFYIYQLTMNGTTQTGLVACASVDEYQNGSIKKHELTRADKEEDRIRHVDICNANTGPIFLAYRARLRVDAIMQGIIKASPPEYDFTAEDGIRHSVWVIHDDAAISEIISEFESVSDLYIADGHHRNASAAKVALKRRENVFSGYEEFNFYLAVLFPADQLCIMDYNRLVKFKATFGESELFEKLGQKFEIKKCDFQAKPEKIHDFGMYMNSQWYLLTARPEIVKGDVVGRLDVSILQDNVLTPIFGITDPRTDKNIDFVGGIRGLAELERRVDSGEFDIAFAMFPTSMAELMDIADSGMIMPPKSTWFEPKLRSGLFVHSLE